MRRRGRNLSHQPGGEIGQTRFILYGKCPGRDIAGSNPVRVAKNEQHMDEFTRPFTEEEFDKSFLEAGYLEIACPVYESVYKEAMSRGATPDEADRLANCCEHNSVNGYLLLERREFMKEFTELWQRYIYARLTIDEIKKSEGGTQHSP